MKVENNWFALEITAISEASEAVEYALNELDALGTEINNLGKKPTATLVINGYFNELPNDEIIRAQLIEAVRIYGFSSDAIRKTVARPIETVDWLFEWKKHWKPTETGSFIVAPSWENVENSDKIIVRIEPQMAFGTGTHETTRLCLRAIEENYRTAMSFLDVGTGTGILAIAAVKMNSKLKVQGSKSEINSERFTAYDTDFDSIANAKENAAINDVSGQIDFRVGSISAEDSEYDFVCANITVDVIVPILSLLFEKSKRVLILSGILDEQKDLIVEELKKYDVRGMKIESLGEWVSLIIEK